jgi:predicted O-methyltransferase YrrM
MQERHPLFRRAREFAALQKPLELSPLLRLVEELRPRTVLEIGTQAGGTLYCWCKLADPSAHIVSIDLPGGDFGGGYTREREEEMRLHFPQNGQRLDLIQADSHSPQTLTDLRSRVDGSLDFLFIDGDHTYEGVKQDFEMYQPLVRSGGLIAFHDICEHRKQVGCDVDVYWREIRERYRHEEFIAPPQTWGGIGVLWND